MLRLLQLEFQKIRFSRAAKIFIIIYFALFLSVTLFAMVHFKFGSIDFQLASQGIFNFPYIWHFNTYFAAILKIFLGVVIISTITNEYTNRTLKQNLIDGLSKKEFVLSKFYAIVVFSLVSTLFIFLISLCLGLIYSDYTELDIIFSGLQYLGGYFVKLLGFFSFCFFLAVLVMRAAFAIVALFVWWIIEVIVRIVLSVTFKTGNLADQISQFLPLNAMGNLIKEPFTKMNMVQVSTAGMGLEFDYAVHWYQIVIVLV